jgi:hypothetical protein
MHSAFPIRRILALADLDELELPGIIGLLARIPAALLLVFSHSAKTIAAAVGLQLADLAEIARLG